MRVKDYLLKNKWKSLLAFLAKIFEALLELLIPLVVARLINDGLNANNMTEVWRNGGLLILLPLIGYVSALYCQWQASNASQQVGTELRSALFHKVQSVDMSQLDQFGKGSIIHRITNDTQNLQLAIALILRLGSRLPILLIGSIVMAFNVSPKMAPIFIITGLMIGGLLVFVTLKTNQQNKSVQTNTERIAQKSRENLNGVRDIRAFSNQQAEIKAFTSHNQQTFYQQIKMGNLQSIANPISLLLINLSISLILYLGAQQISSGYLLQGDVVALVNYMNIILLALNVLVNILMAFTKGITAIGRLDEILAIQPTHLTEKRIESLSSPITIEAKDLGFAYGQYLALSDLNFTINPYDFFAVIGGTGAGKSTLVQLLMGFVSPTEGMLSINDSSITSYDRETLRDKLAFVPQENRLFQGTLRENLVMGNENCSDDFIWHCLEVAQAKDFIVQDERGLDQPILALGRNFSGGQKQRLTIARALIAEPDVLILDDATSALDFATEKQLLQELKEMPITMILITQRVNSIRKADRILVLDHGKQVGLGQHQDLLDSSTVYQEIYALQNKEGNNE